MKNILIRCDASKEIGLGHITRCMELAKQLQKYNFNIIFAIKPYPLAIEKLEEKNFSYEYPDLENFEYETWIKMLLEKYKIKTFIGDIRDGFPMELITYMQKKDILTVAIDEPSSYAKECDLCFYPPHANIDKKLYKGKVYQGFEYVILREEFYKPFEKEHHKIPNILVMMGGTDAYNLTLMIVQQLLSLENKHFNISVIINKNHQDYTYVQQSDTRVSVFDNIDTMANFFTKIDYAIASFGMSIYELLKLQIPFITISLDDDHWKSSEILENQNLTKRYKKEEINISFDILTSLKTLQTVQNKHTLIEKILYETI